MRHVGDLQIKIGDLAAGDVLGIDGLYRKVVAVEPINLSRRGTPRGYRVFVETGEGVLVPPIYYRATARVLVVAPEERS